MDNKRYRDADNEAAEASAKRTRLDPASSPVGSGAIKDVAHQALHRAHKDDSRGRSSNGFVAVNSPINGSSPGRTSASSSITAATDRAPLETLLDVNRRFNQAASTGRDRRTPTYAEVNVLLLYWDEDSREVKDATRRLESVFRQSFNYSTEVFSIPSANAEHELNSVVASFFSKNNTPEKLAILHYAGRCLASEDSGAPPIWMPRHDGANIVVDSGTIESAYNRSLCDVLLLLDHNCIRHPQYTRNPLGTAKRKVVEVVDAPPVESEQAHISFTKALANELSAVAYGDSITVETLHRQVAARMTIHKPRGRGRPPKEPVPRPIADQQHLPNHYFLQENRSIVLAPIPNEPQVVLCIRILKGIEAVTRWTQWIFDAEPRARNSVQFEGLRSGFSTMIVLRIPASEWESFSDCPAELLVGYTTIGDIPLNLLDKIDTNLSAKLWDESSPSRPVEEHPTIADHTIGYEPSSTTGFTRAPNAAHGPGDPGLRKVRKALPTERKILPSGPSSLPSINRRVEHAPIATDRPIYRPPQSNLQQQQQQQRQQEQQRISQQELSRQLVDSGYSERDALLVAAAQKPFKISIKLAGQNHMCDQCKAGFKDVDSLQNHVRKQHTRPFHCVFKWAGCDSTFASKNEWKRHVMSQHILLHYWVCRVETCSKIVNKTPGAAHNGFSLPNGTIFNRKDLFTQHLRRMHTPANVKKLMRPAKMAGKTTNHPAFLEWENRLKDLQQDGVKPRCRLPDFMICPSPGCGVEFHGNSAWDDRMEHVARHLEGAAAGREPLVVFGGKTDPTLTNWATRPEVGIAKRVGPDEWKLDNPIRPVIQEWTGHGSDNVAASQPRAQIEEHERVLPSKEHPQQEGEDRQQHEQNNDEPIRYASPSDGRNSRERSRSVIEVAVPNTPSPPRDDTPGQDPERTAVPDETDDLGADEKDATKNGGRISPRRTPEAQQEPSGKDSDRDIVVGQH